MFQFKEGKGRGENARKTRPRAIYLNEFIYTVAHAIFCLFIGLLESDAATDLNTVVFKLSVHCTRKPGVSPDEKDPAKLYDNHIGRLFLSLSKAARSRGPVSERCFLIFLRFVFV